MVFNLTQWNVYFFHHDDLFSRAQKKSAAAALSLYHVYYQCANPMVISFALGLARSVGPAGPKGRHISAEASRSQEGAGSSSAPGGLAGTRQREEALPGDIVDVEGGAVHTPGSGAGPCA